MHIAFDNLVANHNQLTWGLEASLQISRLLSGKVVGAIWLKPMSQLHAIRLRYDYDEKLTCSFFVCVELEAGVVS